MEKHQLIIYGILGIVTLALIAFLFPVYKHIFKNPNLASIKTLKQLFFTEVIGYGILFISLAWIFIDQPLSSMNKDIDQHIIEKKLDYLWEYLLDEDNRKRTMDQIKQNPHSYSLSESFYKELNKIETDWINLESYGKEAKEQAELSNRIRLFLVALSTILIAVGRFGSYFKNIKELEKLPLIEKATK